MDALRKIEMKEELQFRTGEYVRWHGPGYRKYESRARYTTCIYIPGNFPSIGFFLDEINNVRVEGKEVIITPVGKRYECEVWICRDEQEAKKVGRS